jgi:probable HAF family extracellular repeat protein
MTNRTMRHVLRPLGAAMTLWLTACGGDNGAPPPINTATATVTRTTAPTATNTAPATVSATPTRTPTLLATPHPSPTRTPALTPLPSVTPTPSGGNVVGLVVVNRTVMSGPDDVLGAPPPEWSDNPDKAPFDRSLGYADWLVPEVNAQGVTGPDGRFTLSGLPPGHYSFQVTKTLAGNLATLSFPFAVGDDGSAEVVAEVAWGLVRSTSTYIQAGAQVQEIHGPYGTSLILQDGHVREIGDASRRLVDADGDGRFDTPPCVEQVWECGVDSACGDDRVCACTASCPFCDDCGPGVCVPPGPVYPYRCGPDNTCSQAGDRCICVSSCPDCQDCARSVCVPDCVPVEITAIEITGGPSELVVGQQGAVTALARLSDGGQIDVTHLATWHSSNDAAATVDSWGQVLARGVGSAMLTASVGTLTSAPWTVTVVARPTLLRIDIQNVSCYYPLGVPTDFGSQPPVAAPPTSAFLPPIPSCGQVVQIGKTIQFKAVGEFANGYYQDITAEVQWQVTPAAVGDVVAGLFTAQQAGTATLTASLDGVVSDDTNIRVVTEPTVVALSIYADSGIIAFTDGGPQRVDVAIPCPFASVDAPCCCPGPLAGAAPAPCDCGYTITVLRGDQVKFRATAQYDTGEFVDVSEQVTWRSSNTAAAAIDAHGVMTAVEAGDAVIDAVLDDIGSNTVGVHVVNQATLQFLYIYQDGTDRVVAKGDQRFFKATGNYDIGFGRDVTSAATWRSSDDGIGGFDTPGVFTARAAGTVQVWAELEGKQSDRISLEVYETSDITYCDPAHVNRAVWSDNFNLVTLESDCGEYRQPGVVGLRYTVAELQPHGGIFDPCLDLYVYQGGRRVRTIREEGCGDPSLPAAAPGRDEAVLKYQLRAFWDLKGEDGQPVAPGTYTIYGRFYLYFDPVVSIDLDVLPAGGTLPTRTPTPTVGPVCTPPFCPSGRLVCPDTCPGGCGYICVPPDQVVSLDVGAAAGVPGDTVGFPVSLHSGAQPVARMENDLFFDPAVGVAAQADGEPDCTGSPDIGNSSAKFTFIPTGCHPGLDCRGIHAAVVAADAPIPDAVVLYTCTVFIPDNAAAGSYGLFASGVTASDPAGGPLLGIGSSGTISVLGSPGETPPTATPTPTSPGVCDAPMCEPGEVPICPGSCPDGCGYICATPTPTAAVMCTPPLCKAGEALFCPGDCPGGCGTVCVTVTPEPFVACFESVECQGEAHVISKSLCCSLQRQGLPITWCPLEQFDPSTGECAACADESPCAGLPAFTPQPTLPPTPPLETVSFSMQTDHDTYGVGATMRVTTRLSALAATRWWSRFPVREPLETCNLNVQVRRSDEVQAEVFYDRSQDDVTLPCRIFDGGPARVKGIIEVPPTYELSVDVPLVANLGNQAGSTLPPGTYAVVTLLNVGFIPPGTDEQNPPDSPPLRTITWIKVTSTATPTATPTDTPTASTVTPTNSPATRQSPGPSVHAFSWTQAGGMIDLGTLGGPSSQAWGVDNGQVVGDSDHAFSWTQAGGMIDLGTLGGPVSVARGVSSGQVVGWSQLSGDVLNSWHAFSWTQAGGMVDLGTLGGPVSEAFGVTNGQVVGDSSPGSNINVRHAFSWTQAGGMIDLGTLGGSSSQAWGVDNGQVVGWSMTAGDASQHAFSWTQAGGMIDLGTLGGPSSQAWGVDNGQVVGDSDHAFSWTLAGGMVDLGTLGGSYSSATGLSNGQVVGYAYTSGDAEQHAFSWTSAGGMIDLGTLHGPPSSATGVSNGQVVGWSW